MSRTNSIMLSPKEFFARFEANWNRLSREFLKLETLQSYEEPDDPSYIAFKQGDLVRAKDLLRERLEAQRPFFDSAKARGVAIVRVRVIERPVSPYIRYELMGYEVSVGMGERIIFVEREVADRLGLSWVVRDLLVFDDREILVHDYSPSGFLRGATVVQDRDQIHKTRDALQQLIANGQDYSLASTRDGLSR